MQKKQAKKKVKRPFLKDKYHDLYVKSDTFLLANVFENFRNTGLEIFQLDSACFPTTPVLTWIAALKSIN